jgi:hypothetical protein
MQRFRDAVVTIPNVATDPAPEVSLLEMNLVGPVIAVRPYTGTDHYWQVLLRHQRSHRAHRTRGRLAGTHAGADHARRAGLRDARLMPARA